MEELDNAGIPDTLGAEIWHLVAELLDMFGQMRLLGNGFQSRKSF
jgi:hypothetical protein